MRTGIAGRQRSVGHYHALATLVRLSGNSTVVGPPPAALGVARRLLRTGVAIAAQSPFGRRRFIRFFTGRFVPTTRRVARSFGLLAEEKPP